VESRQLWEAFDKVCVELYKKRQKVTLMKKHNKEKTPHPEANEDEAMKEIDEFTMTYHQRDPQYIFG
jgi:hypothetical protein